MVDPFPSNCASASDIFIVDALAMRTRSVPTYVNKVLRSCSVVPDDQLLSRARDANVGKLTKCQHLFSLASGVISCYVCGTCEALPIMQAEVPLLEGAWTETTVLSSRGQSEL